jgi:hypothetical protein
MIKVHIYFNNQYALPDEPSDIVIDNVTTIQPSYGVFLRFVTDDVDYLYRLGGRYWLMSPDIPLPSSQVSSMPYNRVRGILPWK